MVAKPSRHIVALISLLVFFLTGQAGVQGYVWCLGEDGHADLEYAAGQGCGPNLKQSQWSGVESLLSPLQEEHCGSCFDMPSSHDATFRPGHSQKKFSSHLEVPAAGLASPNPSFIRDLTANLYSQPPPRISQTILSHRTVVLLN